MEKYNLEKLEDYKFYKFFEEISNIPRSPGKEEKIAKYLVDFAIKRNLRYYIDDIYNVIIWKQPSKGYEKRRVLGLQNHTDMVCQKTEKSNHNFDTDPIELLIDGDYVRANNTTLGADNGIGIAYVLAILDSEEIFCPELECIFTVQEETTMNGSRYIDVSKLKSKRIISCDSFYEDQIIINSASCKEWNSSMELKYEKIEEEYSIYELKLSDFLGGHSGANISDSKRGNCIKIGVELLKDITDIRICSIEGGIGMSAIPTRCLIKFCVPNTFKEYKKLIGEIIYYNLVYSDAGNIEIKKINNIEKCLDKISTTNILKYIKKFENGVQKTDRYSQVILSANLAKIKICNNKLYIDYSVRSNKKEYGDKYVRKLGKLMKECNIEVNKFDEMKPFESKKNNKISDLCLNQYKELYGKKINKVKSQTCLDIGFLADRIDNLEYIAIAPNIYNAHSTEECFSISSANRFWKYFVKIIENA